MQEQQESDEIILSTQQGDILFGLAHLGCHVASDLRFNLADSISLPQCFVRVLGKKTHNSTSSRQHTQVENTHPHTAKLLGLITSLVVSQVFRLQAQTVHFYQTQPHLLFPSPSILSILLFVLLWSGGGRLGTPFAFINITLADRVIFRNQAAGECHL